MRYGTGAAIVVSICLAVIPSVAAAAARLRLVNTPTGTAVLGSGFHSRERVRVVVTATDTRLVRATRASRTGSFRVVFDRMPFGPCVSFGVRAIGSEGGRATLKLLPARACAPERNP